MALAVSVPCSATSSTGETVSLPCVMAFNANDPCGAGGIGGDAMTCACVGAHALSVVTGTLVRDTAEVFADAVDF